MDLGRLPFVPFAALAQRTPIRELYEMSLISDRARQWIHMSGVEVHAFGILADHRNGFFIQTARMREALWFTLDDGVAWNQVRRHMNINGYQLNMTFLDMVNNNYYCRSTNPDVDMLRLWHYFSDLLVIRYSHVNMDIGRLAEFRPIFSHPRFNRRCEILYLSGELASNEDVMEIIQYFDDVTCLVMTGDYLPTLRCPKIFAAEHIDIENGMFVTKEDIMNLRCRTAKVVDTNFTEEDMNEILLNWMNSNNKTLEKLIIGGNPIPDLETLTQDMMYTLFDATKRSRYHRSPNFLGAEDHVIDTLLGRDIVNRDGVIGSVGVEDGELVFVVFHNRFHEPFVQPA